MKTRHSALFLAATLLAAPALVSAASHGPEGRPGHGGSEMKEGCGPGERMGMKERGHHGKHHGRHGMMGEKMMDPARFEQHLSERLAELDSPELKAQFFATHQARLASMEQQLLMHKLMAEDKAADIEDADLKAATLEKIAADSKLRQQRLKMMQDTLDKLRG
ncbi:hypothetical protein C7H85_17260 [Zobellella endophytica]|uniref:Periplasmic heavy metal sensor n=1 Tax=Zobellella endophytica TaxID=2116700 RepID=A0A2P7QWM1_9GAMM|nr:hypothetical protein [Zobellella endophytica]PSJ42359.1 hypothetical protein C7H85_17260 [Zobellella endophytica]